MKTKLFVVSLLCFISLSASAGLLPKAYKYTKKVIDDGYTYCVTEDTILTGDHLTGGVFVGGKAGYQPIVNISIGGTHENVVKIGHYLQGLADKECNDEAMSIIMENGEVLYIQGATIYDTTKKSFYGLSMAWIDCYFSIKKIVNSSKKGMSSMSDYDKIAYVQHVLSDSEIARIKVKDIIVKPKDSWRLSNTFRYMFNELSEITGDKYIYNDEDLENAINSQGSSLGDRLVLPN